MTRIYVDSRSRTRLGCWAGLICISMRLMGWLGFIRGVGVVVIQKLKKTSYNGKSRRNAFRQTKHDANIPMSQQPKIITTLF